MKFFTSSTDQLYLGIGQRGNLRFVIARTSPNLVAGEDSASMRFSEARPEKRVTNLDMASHGFPVQLDTQLNESMRYVTTTIGGSTALNWSSCL